MARNQSPANPGRLAAADGGEAILRVSDRHQRFRFDPAGVIFGASEDHAQLRQALYDPGFSAAPVDGSDRGLEADLAGEVPPRSRGDGRRRGVRGPRSAAS